MCSIVAVFYEAILSALVLGLGSNGVAVWHCLVASKVGSRLLVADFEGGVRVYICRQQAHCWLSGEFWWDSRPDSKKRGG